MNKFAEIIIKFRWFFIIFFIAISIISAQNLRKVEIESDVKKQLPQDMESILTVDKIEELFGGTDMAMIIIQSENILSKKTLKRVKKISKKLKRAKGVDKVLSLFELKEIKGEDGAMIVNPAVKRIPRKPEDEATLKESIINNDMVYGSVVSKDFKATAVIAQLKSKVSDAEISKTLKDIVKSIPGKEKVTFGGMPFVRNHLANDIRTDMKKFMPYGLVIMLIFLWICFRQLRGVILPFVVVILSIMFGMGLIPLLGWKIHMVTVLLPVILIAVANDYGIHIMSKYQEDNRKGNSLTKEELAKNGFKSLGAPVLATGITTMAGLLCLMSHIIVPAEQLGILSAISIFYALFASLIFIPSVLSVLPKAKPVISGNHEEAHILEKMLHFIAVKVSKNPKKIILISVLLTAVLSLGIFNIVVDTNPEGYYPSGHPVIQSSNIVNEKFGGANIVSIVAKGDIKDPKIMRKIDNLEHKLKAMPEVGNTMSLGKVVRQMSRAINDKNEKGYDAIPESRNAIAQYFELYSMSGDPDDFEKLVDFPYEHSHITARVASTSSEVMKKVVNRVKDEVKDDKNFIMVGGFTAIFTELVDEVVSGQIKSLTLSLSVVAFLVMLLFRSFFAGIIASIPLALSLVLLFGIMGYSGIELNIPTAMLSSIMVGVGIDYTIHFLWRYKEELKNGHDHMNAVIETLTTVGRGIVFNALSVIVGFVVLLLSSFLPVNFFGLLVLISISTCLVGALVLLPALCIVAKPKFLEPKNI